MRAVFIEGFGGVEVLRCGELPRPAAGRGQVLVEVHAAAVNPRDWLVREGRYQLRFLMPGFPLILGSDLSGVVVEAGPGAGRFRPGDAVFGMQTALGRMGCHAEYVAIAESALARKPESVSHMDAAAAPCAALTAWDALVRIARVGAGTRVLVVGASGGVGTYAVQLAKALGATVTGVTSTGNVELVRSLGAERVIDYKTQRFAEVAGEHDLVFDTIGREDLDTVRPVLAADGRYVTTLPNERTGRQAFTSRFARLLQGGRGHSAHVAMVKADGAALARIAELMAAGRIRSVIDSTYPLEQAAAAHERSRSFRSRGKLVLQVR